MNNEKDFLSILDANTFLVDSAIKVGKVTFVAYLITALFKEKALIFTPQENFLFKRRLASLKKQFMQFENIEETFDPLYLKEEWSDLKQKYGFEFFIKELEHILGTSEEKIVVVHRFEEYFDYQDRYEIDHIYKALIKLARTHNKKIFFLVNSKHDNYEYIHNVSDEFSDVIISITVNDKNERIINIKDILHNKEYPYMSFAIHNETFLLDYYKETSNEVQDRVKNILIAQLDKADDNLSAICEYIYDRDNFHVKHADSLKTILQEVFVRPDVVIVMMKRTRENLETVKSIKTQLKNSSIITVLDQDFVRAEDMQEAYSYGCDELFSNNLSLDTLILALQKASKSLFYSEEVQRLPKYPNIMNNLGEMKDLAIQCTEKSIFFTLFIFKVDISKEKVKKISRRYDFIYQTENKLYYIALSTAPKDVKYILQKHESFELETIWEPINHTRVEDFFND